MSEAVAETSPVLLFDGECVMCNSTVHFVANRDAGGRVRFASLQSRFADSVAAQHGAAFPRDLSTVVLLDRERHVWFTKSDAALRTATLLAWPWNWLGAALLCAVPRCVRDAVYDVVARNRYRWFGKHEHVSVERWKKIEKAFAHSRLLQEDGETCRFSPIVRERTIDNATYQHHTAR